MTRVLSIVPMWFDELEPGRSWTMLWHGYIRCSCGGIRSFANCGRCGIVLDNRPQRFLDQNGHEFEVAPALMGAEDRFEDWILLAMIEREWKRQDGGHAWLDSIPEAHRPSPRANVALLFWTYFETRIGRLLRTALAGLRTPPMIADDMMDRYWSINARMNQAYGVLFENRTYRRDLEDLGFDDVWALLQEVQHARNRFIHGAPEAITDVLVTRIVQNLKREHESWIAVFNLRAPRI